MVSMRKLDREVRRILHKLPLVGRHVTFPPRYTQPPKTPSVSHPRMPSGRDRLYEMVESHLYAIAGLRDCSHKQQKVLMQLEESVASLFEQHRSLSERLEFVRAESLLEIRRVKQIDNSSGISEETTVEIIDADAVEKQKQAKQVRINIGCGHKPLDGYLNVDARQLPGVQVVAPVSKLPFEENSLTEIHSAHLMEHFRQDEMVNVLLPYWFTLLSPGGTFTAIVPDGAAMMKSYAEGQMSFEDIRLVTYGGQEYEGNFHYTMFSAETMKLQLEAAGFVNVVIVAEGRRNGLCLEMEVKAEKPKQ